MHKLAPPMDDGVRYGWMEEFLDHGQFLIIVSKTVEYKWAVISEETCDSK